LRSTLPALALGALIAVVTTAGEARADPRVPEVEKALEALRTRRYEDAIKACTPGPNGKLHSPCPLIQAHALHALGKHLEAYEALRIHGGDEATTAPVAQEALRSVLLAHLARVTVACSVEGPADIRVNGQLAHTCPTAEPIVTEPGEIAVEVRRAGFETAQIKVKAAAGSTVPVRIDLVPTPGAAHTIPQTKNPEAIAETNAEPAVEPKRKDIPAFLTAPIGAGPRSPRSLPPSDPPPRPSSGSSCGAGCVFWIVVGGVAVVGMGVGIVALATAERIPAPTGDIPPGQVRVPW
jgi:hypothetical protein